MDAELSKTLGEMNGKLDTLIEFKIAHVETHKTIDRDIGDFRSTLYGNPNGLKSRVERLWACKKDITDWRNFWKGVLQRVASYVIIGLIVWGLLVYKTHDTTKKENQTQKSQLTEGEHYDLGKQIPKR